MTVSPTTRSVTDQLGAAPDQPSSRSWSLKWYETGIFFAAAAILAAVGILWVRRRRDNHAVGRLR